MDMDQDERTGPRNAVFIEAMDDFDEPTLVELVPPDERGFIPVIIESRDPTPTRKTMCMACGQIPGAFVAGALTVLAELRLEMERAGVGQDTIEQTVQRILDNTGLST